MVGHETTASMISLGTLMLLQHDEQREQLTRDPSLMPGAVEELLRYLSIVHLTSCRVAIEDIEIGGETIKAGEGIVALVSSANRDKSQFENPDVLDFNRGAKAHVAFGFGVHQCLGQTLARAELRMTLNSILRKIPTLKLAQPVADLKFKDYINGVQSMMVAW
jgi:cytochrome P450